jgi:hypothetical protein|tara:strand:+ start:106 stop:297 length:192 start_codon:yes stop_codon:yes gene_type:complete
MPTFNITVETCHVYTTSRDFGTAEAAEEWATEQCQTALLDDEPHWRLSDGTFEVHDVSQEDIT